MTHRWRTLACLVLAGVLASASAHPAEMTLRLTVPARVAAEAGRRAAGDGSAAPPILVLEGVEVASDEGLEITVLGPPREGGGPGPILGSTAMVGSPQGPRVTRKFTLPIPLNDEGARLVAGRGEVALTLRTAGRRPPASLKFDRASFQEP
jgi:hypothetical protein